MALRSRPSGQLIKTTGDRDRDEAGSLSGKCRLKKRSKMELFPLSESPINRRQGGFVIRGALSIASSLAMTFLGASRLIQVPS